MTNKLFLILSVCFLLALLPMISAFPTVQLGPSPSSGGAVYVTLNQTGNFTFITTNVSVTQVLNYTYNITNNITIINNITNNITTINNYTNNITEYANMTNVAFTNGSMDWGGNNVTSFWFKGLFNWTALAQWLSFDGATLSFNETTFNNSVVTKGLEAGFNLTYNKTYDDITNSWNANYTAYKDQWYNTSVPDQAYADSLLVTKYYNATSLTTITGTPQGVLANIQSYNNVPYNVSEVNSDFDLRVNFTDVTTNITQLIIRYKSDAAETHVMHVEIWDVAEGVWENYGTVGLALDYNVLTYGVYDAEEHNDGGLVRVRFWTTNVGGSTHKHEFDWVSLSSGPAVPSSVETDPIWSDAKQYYVNSSEDYTLDTQNYTLIRTDIKNNWTDLETRKLNLSDSRFNDSTFIINVNSSLYSWVDTLFLKIADMYTKANLVLMIAQNMSQADRHTHNFLNITFTENLNTSYWNLSTGSRITTYGNGYIYDNGTALILGHA